MTGPTTPPSQQNDETARYVATARTDLQENDLAGARSALKKAMDEGPADGEALTLNQELLSREQARDAALSTARACLAQRSWKCAWHSAGNALSIDSSSAEASALVQRSLVDWGAANQPARPGTDPGP